MRQFTHLDASTTNEAAKEGAKAGSQFIAGGTDLIGSLKDEILPTYPRQLVNLKTIPNLSYIKEEDGVLKIGPLTTLDELAANETVRSGYAALATAAGRVSAPIQRAMGTLGGNICQMHRCWYFRTPENRFECMRKGGGTCYAMAGDNRYHSIFGAEEGCIASSPHDTAPALIALDARIVTTTKEYAAEDFFAANGVRSTVLAAGEVVTEIRVPKPAGKSAFIKYAERKAIDFPVVNCAVAQLAGGVRVVCGAVFPKPLRMTEAEAAVAGGITEGSAAAAGDAAVAKAVAYKHNGYKVEITRTLVKRALLEIA